MTNTRNTKRTATLVATLPDESDLIFSWVPSDIALREGTWTVVCGGCEETIESGYRTLRDAVVEAATSLTVGPLAHECIVPEDDGSDLY